MVESTTKNCSKCKEQKPVSEFSKAGKGYLRSYCKACQSVENAKRPRKRPVLCIPEGYAHCSRCKEMKAIIDFYPNRTNKRGVSTYCKLCSREARAEYASNNRLAESRKALRWRLANPERAKEIAKKTRTKHRDKRMAETKEWKASHRERVRVLDSGYRQRNQDKIREAARSAYHANPKIFLDRTRAYNKKYPEKTRLRRANNCAVRRARIAAARVERVSYKTILERDKGICHICGLPIGNEKYNFDHVIPLSKGGPHSTDNIRLSHATCNFKKGAKYEVE